MRISPARQLLSEHYLKDQVMIKVGGHAAASQAKVDPIAMRLDGVALRQKGRR
jgi:hypothetical protein